MSALRSAPHLRLCPDGGAEVAAWEGRLADVIGEAVTLFLAVDPAPAASEWPGRVKRWLDQLAQRGTCATGPWPTIAQAFHDAAAQLPPNDADRMLLGRLARLASQIGDRP